MPLARRDGLRILVALVVLSVVAPAVLVATTLANWACPRVAEMR